MVSFPVFINICVTENGCKVDITRKTHIIIVMLTLLLENYEKKNKKNCRNSEG